MSSVKDPQSTLQPLGTSRPVRPKYQVFVSSTLQDLRAEREAVTWEVLKAGHIPVGMENFSAQNDRGWKVIERTLQTTDYYVLILAGRYGTVDDDLGISWTEREYRRALELRIPILAFIRERREIPGDQVDIDEKAKKLANFIADVNKQCHRETWTTADDLRARVNVALLKSIQEDEMEENPRPGWYRGDQLPSLATVDELARLSRENRDQRDELEKLRTQLSSAPRVALKLVDEDGQPLTTLRQQRPLYIVKHPRETAILLSFRSANTEAVEEFIKNINRTFWFRLTLKNEGPSPARNVTVDMDVKGADDVAFYPDDAPEAMPIAIRGPTWATDPSEHVYVDRWELHPDRLWIRQRVANVGVNRDEALLRLGLRAANTADDGFNFKVSYLVTDENGERFSGDFDIEVVVQGELEADMNTLEKAAKE